MSDRQGHELQFDRAELTGPAPALRCATCDAPLASSYYEVNGQLACERCRFEAERALARSPGIGGFLRAAAAGTLAGGVGAGLWYGVRALTDAEWGIVAIVVGLLVGFAVRWGSRGAGGWKYQTLAVALTYLAIVSTYVPLIFQFAAQQGEAQEAGPGASPAAAVDGDAAALPTKAPRGAAPAAADEATAAAAPAVPPATRVETIDVGQLAMGVGALLLVAVSIPFLGGFQNLMGLLIIGIALWQAWKINARSKLTISGPFTVAARGASTAA
jgi:hypothetical protein